MLVYELPILIYTSISIDLEVYIDIDIDIHK
jgi:hypothetical protein